MDPGASFRLSEPRSREERLAMKDKDHLEKERMRRRGVNGPEPVYNPLLPAHNSPMYIDDRERFSRDAAAAEHQRRLAETQHKEAVYERKRMEHYWREKQRWEHEDKVHQKYENMYQYKRETCQGGTRKNKSGEDYNIISLHYQPSPSGQELRYKDDLTMYKAQVRSDTLYTKANSVTHNIITGQPLPGRAPPLRPLAPWEK